MFFRDIIILRITKLRNHGFNKELYMFEEHLYNVSNLVFKARKSGSSIRLLHKYVDIFYGVLIETYDRQSIIPS